MRLGVQTNVGCRGGGVGCCGVFGVCVCVCVCIGGGGLATTTTQSTQTSTTYTTTKKNNYIY